MTDPVPAVPGEEIVQHTEAVALEPTNDEKIARNMSAETVEGDAPQTPDPPPWRLPPPEEPVEDPNAVIAAENMKPHEVEGDTAQTPDPAPWRVPQPLSDEPLPPTQNDLNAERNRMPEKVVGTMSAEEANELEPEPPPPEEPQP